MITSELSETFETCPSNTRITVVLHWLNITEKLSMVSADRSIGMLAEIKQPIIELFESLPNVRVNTLRGMPDAIVEAPACVWKEILEKQPILQHSKDVLLEVNYPVACTLRNEKTGSIRNTD